MKESTSMRKPGRLDRVFRALAILVWIGALLLLWTLCLTKTEMPAAHVISVLVASYFQLWGLIFLVSGSAQGQNIKRFALTTVTLCVIIGGFELLATAKLVNYRDVFGTPAYYEFWRRPQVQMDDELMYQYEPYAHLKGTTLGDSAIIWRLRSAHSYPYDVRCDRHGFRNAEDLEWADIAVLGDSFIEATFVEFPKILTSRLADRLGCTVANLGQEGYGPQQELVVLRRYALPLNPQVCVWAFFERNDLTDVHRYEQTIKDWPRHVEAYHSVSDRSFLKNLALALPRVLRERSEDPIAEERMGLFLANGSRTKLYFAYPGGEIGPEQVDALDRFRETIATAQRLCEERGIRLVVVFIPSKFRVYHQFCEYPPTSQATQWSVNNLPQRMQRLLREVSESIGYLDLTPALIDRASQGELLYFTDDTHWNEAGHRVAAEQIESYLIGSDYIKPKGSNE